MMCDWHVYISFPPLAGLWRRQCRSICPGPLSQSKPPSQSFMYYYYYCIGLNLMHSFDINQRHPILNVWFLRRLPRSSSRLMSTSSTTTSSLAWSIKNMDRWALQLLNKYVSNMFEERETEGGRERDGGREGEREKERERERGGGKYRTL